jgi:hypothetical protein
MPRFVRAAIVFVALVLCSSAYAHELPANSTQSSTSLPVNLTGACVAIASKTSTMSVPAVPRYTSLHLAAAENCIESACILLTQGADINARNK